MRYTVTEVKFTRESAQQTSLTTYKRAGRWISRAFGPWVDVNEAFCHRLAKDEFFDIENTTDTDE